MSDNNLPASQFSGNPFAPSSQQQFAAVMNANGPHLGFGQAQAVLEANAAPVSSAAVDQMTSARTHLVAKRGSIHRPEPQKKPAHGSNCMCCIESDSKKLRQAHTRGSLSSLIVDFADYQTSLEFGRRMIHSRKEVDSELEKTTQELALKQWAYELAYSEITTLKAEVSELTNAGRILLGEHKKLALDLKVLRGKRDRAMLESVAMMQHHVTATRQLMIEMQDDQPGEKRSRNDDNGEA